jgi:outer membrane protein OmpA-like peptidoglycan-associated protein
MTRRGWWSGGWPIVLALAAAAGLAAASGRAGEPPVDPETLALQSELLAPVRSALNEAKALGAGKTLPRLRDAAEAAVAAAAARIAADPDGARAGACAETVREAQVAATHLWRTARFVRDLRRQKQAWQAVADVYDRDLRACARAAGVAPNPAEAGVELARAVVDSLGRRRLRCLGLADSLGAERRLERETLRLELVERDSSLTDLRRRLSDLQQSLWEMELRAGVAEADRAAVEAHLRAGRERAALVRQVIDLFMAAGGEAVLSPVGDLVLRHHGLAFGAGRSEVTPAMAEALAAVLTAVSAFPGAALRVEGHTDDSGGRAENLRLARARAEAVATELRVRLAALAARAVTVEGVGPDRPLVSNQTAAGREQNRRIEVVVVMEGGAP